MFQRDVVDSSMDGLCEVLNLFFFLIHTHTHIDYKISLSSQRDPHSSSRHLFILIPILPSPPLPFQQAMETAENKPKAQFTELFNDVYDEPLDSLKEQQQDLIDHMQRHPHLFQEGGH